MKIILVYSKVGSAGRKYEGTGRILLIFIGVHFDLEDQNLLGLLANLKFESILHTHSTRI